MDSEYDVLVCGGGAAGAAAAIGAARRGAKTLLVERYGFMGGAATTSQVLTYCGFHQRGELPVPAVGGVGLEVLEALRANGDRAEARRSPSSGNWTIPFDPELLKYCLDCLVTNAGVRVALHTSVVDAATRDGDVEAVTLSGLAETRTVSARAFVDASGDGNLARHAGVPCRDGDGAGRYQAMTMPLRIGGVPEGLELDRAALTGAIAEHNASASRRIERADGGVFIRLPYSGDCWWMAIDLALDDLCTDDIARAEIAGRALAQDCIRMLRARVPGFAHARLIATGPQIGIRETRHPAARYELTEIDLLEGRLRDTGVARAAWPMEIHERPGKPVFTPVGGAGFAHVPLEALRARGLDNLMYGGRVVGASPTAYGSIRVMGTGFATGQAAGVAAAEHVQAHGAADIVTVRAALVEQGAII